MSHFNSSIKLSGTLDEQELALIALSSGGLVDYGQARPGSTAMMAELLKAWMDLSISRAEEQDEQRES